MSNYLAIAAVTTTLRMILEAAVQRDVPGSSVTTLRPDGDAGGGAAARANLFLYQVTPNAGLRNLPPRNDASALVTGPAAALDLHYLISFYGDERLLEPQRLLGTVVRTLHSQPLLGRKQILDAIAGAVAAGAGDLDFLNGSDLADAADPVRVMPAGLSLEDLSKLWSALLKVEYALSIAYVATVVLIDPDVPLAARSRYA